MNKTLKTTRLLACFLATLCANLGLADAASIGSITYIAHHHKTVTDAYTGEPAIKLAHFSLLYSGKSARCTSLRRVAIGHVPLQLLGTRNIEKRTFIFRHTFCFREDMTDLEGHTFSTGPIQLIYSRKAKSFVAMRPAQVTVDFG